MTIPFKMSGKTIVLKERLLFVMHYPPPMHGAGMMGKYIKESALINSNFQIDYVNLSTSKTIHKIGQGEWGKLLRYVQILGRVIQIVLKERPKWVYFAFTVTGLGFYKDTVLVLFARLMGCKIIFHLHNKGIAGVKPSKIKRWLYQMVFKGTSTIILSDLLRYDLKGMVQDHLVHVCHNGIPFYENETFRNPSQNTRVTLLFFSNLMESKGVCTLLIACQLLKVRGLDFRCKLYGEPGDIAVSVLIKKINDMGLKNIISYGGPKYRQDKEQAFADSDIFVLPTHNDCFPLVILEAMSHQLPIVATYEGAIPEMVLHKKTGLLCEKEKPVKLAHALETLIKDETLRKRMGAAGRNHFMANFTLDAFEKTFVEVVSRIIKT
jgi:glycosyltransferase involved in cell wall biosynthesis